MSYPEQVGGDHYRASIQHWDLMEEHDVAYLEATASKYVTRWQKKGGSEDLRKSATYLERALVEERDARRLVPEEKLEAFFEENGLGGWERAIIRLIHRDGTQVALMSAAILLRDKADDADKVRQLEAQLAEPRTMAAGDRP